MRLYRIGPRTPESKSLVMHTNFSMNNKLYVKIIMVAKVNLTNSVNAFEILLIHVTFYLLSCLEAGI